MTWLFRVIMDNIESGILKLLFTIFKDNEWHASFNFSSKVSYSLFIAELIYTFMYLRIDVAPC